MRKKYYNLLIIFPRWNSLLIYKNLEYIFNLLLGQNFKIYLILNPENIKNLNELKEKIILIISTILIFWNIETMLKT